MTVAAVARIHGLGGHLLDRAALDDLARSGDLRALTRALADLGLVAASSETVEAVEQDLRAVRAERMRLLARWCDGPVADLLFADEDRRTVRILLRTAGQGPARAGLVPTPTLPEPALTALAGQATARAVGPMLVAWGHPYGSALIRASGTALADLERALNRAWAVRLIGARGDRFVREHARWAIDLENRLSLAVGLGQPAVARTAESWLPGGSVSREAYEDRLSAAPSDDLDLERIALGERIRALTRPSREHPLSAAPILAYALRLRAETADLRALVWGMALGRSPSSWVTP